MRSSPPPVDDEMMRNRPSDDERDLLAMDAGARREELDRATGDERQPARARIREREGDRGETGRRGDRARVRRLRRRVCAFCVDNITSIDYKQHQRLREFISDRGKILKSRMTGTCAKHQRALAHAIKRARQVALLPFVSE